MDRVGALQRPISVDSLQAYLPMPPTTIILHQSPSAALPPSPTLRFTPSPLGRTGSPSSKLAQRAASAIPFRSKTTPTPIQTHIDRNDRAFFFHADCCKTTPIYLDLVNKDRKTILQAKVCPDDDGFCAINFQEFQSSSASLPDVTWILSYGAHGYKYEIEDHNLTSATIITISRGFDTPIVTLATQEVSYKIPLVDITKQDRANYEIHVVYPHCGWAYKTINLPKADDLLSLSLLPGSTLYLMNKETNTSVTKHVFSMADQKMTPGIFFVKGEVPTIKQTYFTLPCTIEIICNTYSKPPEDLLNKCISVLNIGENGSCKQVAKATFGFFKYDKTLASTVAVEQGSSLKLDIDGKTYQTIQIPPSSERFKHIFHVTATRSGTIEIE